MNKELNLARTSCPALSEGLLQWFSQDINLPALRPGSRKPINHRLHVDIIRAQPGPGHESWRKDNVWVGLFKAEQSPRWETFPVPHPIFKQRSSQSPPAPNTTGWGLRFNAYLNKLLRNIYPSLSIANKHRYTSQPPWLQPVSAHPVSSAYHHQSWLYTPSLLWSCLIKKFIILPTTSNQSSPFWPPSPSRWTLFHLSNPICHSTPTHYSTHTILHSVLPCTSHACPHLYSLMFALLLFTERTSL